MIQTIRFAQTGGPEVLFEEQIAEPEEPGKGQVLIQQHAIGLNFIDTYYRKGIYAAKLPSGLGNEAAGTVLATGPDVSRFRPGDRVCYAGGSSTLGAYCSARIIAQDVLLKIPDRVSYETAAASTLRGLTAAYLLHRMWPLKSGDTVVIYSAAGGVGLILVQWAKILGLEVIGVVSDDRKAVLAQDHGCDHVLRSSSMDLAEQIRLLTNGQGAEVVFDSVGQKTFQISLNSVRRRGLLVCYGASSGPIPPFDLIQLAQKGSLYITRPTLADYIANPEERDTLAALWFDLLEREAIKVHIEHRYPLSAAAQAHQVLESGRTAGSGILIPDQLFMKMAPHALHL